MARTTQEIVQDAIKQTNDQQDALRELEPNPAPDAQVEPEDRSQENPQFKAGPVDSARPVRTPSMKKGGLVKRTQKYILHRGEVVIPKHHVDAMTGDILKGKKKATRKFKLLVSKKAR